MSPYSRPPLESRIHRDADGDVIEYGRRWTDVDPPAEAYSATSNLDRYRPLQAVADALIAHLRDQYRVDIEEDPRYAEDLMHHRDDVERAVRVVPRGRAGATLTFVYTSFPSVIVHAGALHDFLYPVCGCDACDEDVARLADEMEWQVRAIAAGGYRERLDPSLELGVGFSLADPAVGSTSGTTRAVDLPRARLENAAAMLPPGGRWAAWPPAGPSLTTRSR